MANRLNKRKIYTSPNVGDVLFYETADASLSTNSNPVYGTPHRNTADYPNHKLVYVSPEDENGEVRWFYAADRIEQEAHNWRVSYPYAGLKTAPRFSCFFILPREGYQPLNKGTAHPLDDGDDTIDQNKRFVGAKLAFERQVDTGMNEIDSLYIAVERVYDKVPSVSEQLLFGYERTYPYAGLTTCPRITRTLIIPRNDYSEIPIGTTDPVFTEAKLIDQDQVEVGDETIRSLYVVVRRVYDEVPSISAQEAYNAEIEYPYQGNTTYPRTVRKYVVPRADAATAVIPSVGLDLDGATLAFRRQDRFEGQAEDSRYVLITVAHDRIPDLDTEAEANFLKGYGFQVTRPYGTDDHPRLTWRIPAVAAGYTPTVDYTACPVTGYTGLLLTDESLQVNEQNGGVLDLVRVYDSLPGPDLEMEIREKFANVPEAFIVERKIERLRKPVKNDATITALDSAAPDDVGGALVRTELGVNGNNTIVLESGTSRLTCTFGSTTSVEYDEQTGKVYNVTEEIVDAGTAGADLDSLTGEFSTVRPLNQTFSIKRTQVATTLGTGVDSVTYDDIINYSWPPVLEGINFFGVNYKDEDGVSYLGRYGYDILMKEGYSGPCRATIVESWSPTAQSVPTVVQMRPTEIFFDFPMTRNFRVPSCLHAAISLTETVGSSHPNLATAVTTKSFAATNYTDWPTSITASVQQSKYRGGFRMRVITVYAPA